MKLTVKKLGPIKEAQIDLSKRFMVFVGYNNTGKTYLAQLIWALYDPESVEHYVKKYYEKHAFPFDEDVFSFSKSLVDRIVEEFSSFFVADLLPIIFNVQHDHAILKECEVRFEVDLEKLKASSSKQTVGIRSDKEEADILRLEKIAQELKIRKIEEEVSTTNIPQEVLEGALVKERLILSFLFRTIFSNLNTPMYLPATRLFYPVFYQYIYRIEKEKREEMSKKFLDFLENRKDGGKQQIDIQEFFSFRSPYTKPMNNLISKLYKMNEDLESTNVYSKTLDTLREMMGGDVIMKKTEGVAPIEFFLKTEDRSELDMYISSASVNQLTTLYLYFKYWIKDQGNYLFLDEPEENLHPKFQEKLLKLLMGYLGKGKDNRLLLTTHSIIVSDVINNYLNLSKVKRKSPDIAADLLKELGMAETVDALLQAEDIGIYFFAHGKVVEYTDDEYGVHFADFMGARDKIKKDSELITDKLYEIIQDEEG